MKNRLINRLYLFLLVCVTGFIWLLGTTTPVFAQSKGVTVIPPKFELFANPGDTVTEKVRLRNEADFPVTFNVLVEDFTSTGEEGAVTLEEQTATNYSLAKWMTPELTDITMMPKEEKYFSFTINVPKDAEPGGHYASLLFSSSGETVPGAASVASRVGSLILLRVSGNVKEEAQIETFETAAYSQKGPVVFTLRLKNDGNVHVRPKGTIVVTNLMGKKVAEIPLNGANVLPGAVRKMDTTWDKSNPLGIFNATLVSTYGQQNFPLTSAARFTVVSPVTGVLIALAFIAALVFIITLFTGRKRFKKALKALTDNS